MCENVNLLKDELKSLTDYVENLDIFWDGDANEAYKVRIYAQLYKMNETLNEFTEVCKETEGAIRAYQETEKVVGQLIAGFSGKRRL